MSRRRILIPGTLLAALFVPNSWGESPGAASSILALSPDEDRVFVANAFLDSVSIVDTRSLEVTARVRVGREPRSVALARGRLFVAVSGEDSLAVVDLATLEIAASIPTGDEPHGLVASPDGATVYAASSGSAEVLSIDAETLEPGWRAPVASAPRGLAVTPDGRRLLVTHFYSGEVSVLDAASGQTLGRIATGRDSNLALGIAVSRSGDRAWLAHSRSNSNDPLRLFDNSVLPVVSTLDLAELRHLRQRRIGIDAADRPVNLPIAAAASPDDRLLYVVNSGSDDLSILDLETGLGVGHLDVGSNPRGIVLTRDGTRAYVANAVSCDLSVVDTARRALLATIPLASDSRPAREKRGQVLFFTSALPEISKDRWMSCGSCHFDGHIDGRTWQTPRGPRNTQSLDHVAETLPLHWSADRPNVAAFQETLHEEMGGTGLSERDLENLSLFVHSLRAPASPHRSEDAPTAKAIRLGKVVFQSREAACATCHAGPLFTDRRRHDVGTGGGPLEKAGAEFDTPSLIGLYRSAPYLHDGSAATLADVFGSSGEHRDRITPLPTDDFRDLLAFLRSLGAEDP